MRRMDITLTDEPTRLVAVVRRSVPLAEIRGFFDTAYGDVIAALAAAGRSPGGPALGWLHHDGSPEALDIAAGFPVTDAEIGALADGVEVVAIPGGPSLVAEYVGPYDDLPDAWQAIEDHRRAAGLELRGDTVEEYLTEPTPDGDPTLNRTRLAMM